MRILPGLLALSLLSAPASRACAEGDPQHGKLLYQTYCSACHSIAYNGVGPAHQGVFGRHAGRAPGFDYSPALRAADVVWNDANLDHWLSDPEKFIPGNRMGFSVADPKERADLIEFLKHATQP